ncbi:MAG: thioredoxin [Betaproteobacteria bacterium]|nr:thioredoxin [Betaproteobacteria bacterium]
MTTHALDVTAASFEQEVIEASKQQPVVVDFWAPWCGPCRVLKPILEKLASEYGGRFKLAKVNSDENQELASMFGIRSIPDVMAFKDGKPVSHFLGALPESQVRAFIEKLLPTPSDLERARARELREAGDSPAAVAVLAKTIELDAKSDAARLDLAELLIELKRLDEVDAVLDAVQPNKDLDERRVALRGAAAFARAGASGRGEAELRAQLALNPADHEARLALAGLHAGAQRYREALDELLEIVRREKDWRDGEARRQILAIFSLAEEQPELVADYRRKLAGALY